MASAFPENDYTFRQMETVIGAETLAAFKDAADDMELVADVESQLAEANSAYYKGKYQEAIKLYKEAHVLLESIVDPSARSRPMPATTKPQPDYETAFLSASLEFLNIMPVLDPGSPVMSRTNPVLNNSLPVVGLLNEKISTPNDILTTVLWKQADHYRRTGLSAAENVYMGQARSINSQLTDNIIPVAVKKGRVQDTPGQDGKIAPTIDLSKQVNRL